MTYGRFERRQSKLDFLANSAPGISIGGLAISTVWEKQHSEPEALQLLQLLRTRDLMTEAYPLGIVAELTDEQVELIRTNLPPLIEHRKDKLGRATQINYDVHMARLKAWLDGMNADQMIEDPAMHLPDRAKPTRSTIFMWTDKFGPKISALYPRMSELYTPDVQSFIETELAQAAERAQRRSANLGITFVPLPEKIGKDTIERDGRIFILKKYPSVDIRTDDFDPDRVISVPRDVKALMMHDDASRLGKNRPDGKPDAEEIAVENDEFVAIED